MQSPPYYVPENYQTGIDQVNQSIKIKLETSFGLANIFGIAILTVCIAATAVHTSDSISSAEPFFRTTATTSQ